MASLWIATSCTPWLAPSQPAASDLKSAIHSHFIHHLPRHLTTSATAQRPFPIRHHFRGDAEPAINLAEIIIRENPCRWRLRSLTHFAECVHSPDTVVAMQDGNGHCLKLRTQSDLITLARNSKLSKTIVFFLRFRQ